MSIASSKYASGFSPHNIPGLALWLDATNSASVTRAANVVSAWGDRSSNAYSMSQATVGNRPTYETNVQNGLPSLRFTTTQALTSTAAVSLSADQTWFVSLKPLAAGNLFFFEQSTDTNSFSGGYFYGSNNYTFFTNRAGTGRGFTDASGIGFAVGTWYVTSAMMSNRTNTQTDYYYSINGARRTLNLLGNVQTTSGVNSNFYINPIARVPGSNYLGELIIYNRALTRGEIQLTERYLAYKWGVTLSNEHPYRTVPSTLRVFNPLDICGLASWFDAADTRRMTLIGTDVSSWGDKANLDNSMNAIVAGTFTRTTTGLPCVRFSGTSRYQSTLSNLTRAAYSSDVSTFTMFAVVNTSNTSGVNGSFWNFVSTTNNLNRVCIFANPPSSLFWDGAAFNSPRQTTGLTLTTNSVRLYMFQRSNLTLTFRQFGTATTSNYAATISNLANDSYRITMSETGAAWTGDIHEILWYNRALALDRVFQVELYLAERWGLRASLVAASSMRFFRSLSPVFSPVLISNCSLWLDAADYARFTFSSGNVISTWEDKAGNLQTASSIAAPNYVSELSPPYILFTGSERVRGSAPQLHSPTDGTWTVFAVATTATVSPINLIINYDATPNRIAQFLRTNGSSIETIGFDTVGNPYFATAPGLVENVPFLAGAVATTTSLTAYVNGVAGTTSAFSSPATVTNSNYTVGAYEEIGAGTGFVGNNWVGNIYEVIVYGRNLNIDERQVVEGYLAEKWGVVLLDNHPYKSIPV